MDFEAEVRERLVRIEESVKNITRDHDGRIDELETTLKELSTLPSQMNAALAKLTALEAHRAADDGRLTSLEKLRTWASGVAAASAALGGAVVWLWGTVKDYVQTHWK